MVDWVTNFVETVGYPGIVCLMVLEMFIPIVQSEVVMTFSGFTASQGRLDIFLVVAAGIGGSQAGTVMLYLISRQFSERRVNELVGRWGGWLGLDRDKLERAEDAFRRHDQWAVLIGRFLPGVRGFIAVPAGIQRMPFWWFFALILVGTSFWVGVLTWLGSLLGDNWQKVDQYSSYLTYGVLGALALYVIYRLAVLTKEHVLSG